MATETGYSSAEVKAGFFLALCLALFVAMLFIYGKVARAWRGKQEIAVVFTSVTSLRPDAPVRYNGVEVGRVKDQHPAPDRKQHPQAAGDQAGGPGQPAADRQRTEDPAQPR
jgi:ABC-type transporter Mla subunit MlaD